MAYFPIFIEIEKKKCLVVGGGKIALRKVETLLRYDAQVHVVSREICAEIRALLPPENIYEEELLPSPGDTNAGELLPECSCGPEWPLPDGVCGGASGLRASDAMHGSTPERSSDGVSEAPANAFGKSTADHFTGAALVVAATGSREVNHRVAQFCRERRIPVNVADAPEECTFFFPAVVKKGDISIGVNTGGKSPAVSSQVRRDIEKAIPDYYEAIADQLGVLREYVKSHVEREPDRRKILKQAAASAFLNERTLSQNEINTIIRQVLNHGTVSGGPVGH